LKTASLVTALALAAPLLALAQSSCPAHEYAQYKDQAKTDLGRMSLAFDYCRAWRSVKTLVSGPRRDGCQSELDKIRDALTDAKDYKGLEFARGECNGDYPFAGSKK
jgi:hypothetical protein